MLLLSKHCSSLAFLFVCQIAPSPLIARNETVSPPYICHVIKIVCSASKRAILMSINLIGILFVWFVFKQRSSALKTPRGSAKEKGQKCRVGFSRVGRWVAWVRQWNAPFECKGMRTLYYWISIFKAFQRFSQLVSDLITIRSSLKWISMTTFIMYVRARIS